ncbi:hypothetical protein V7S43_011072 [Phytophthora oleae]|uniref:Uncharacterized protein n=1 Tax=Phytophthora oleae TaxID=2107226 RepID=A0ABD3FB42_9STRA
MTRSPAGGEDAQLAHILEPFADHWNKTSSVPFPVVEATASMWTKAVAQEPKRLLHALRAFSHPHKIKLLGPKVIAEWTKAWRDTCWYAAVRAQQIDPKTDQQRKNKLDEWEQRVSTLTSLVQRRAAINSPQV